jgi:hypothetical protein
MVSRQSGKADRIGKIDLPLNNSDLDLSVSQLAKDASQHNRVKFIEELNIKPNKRQSVMLGDFTEANPPKGFSVEITPDPSPAGSVVTEVATVETPKGYKLVMLIANQGARAVKLKVRQL